MRTSYWNGKHIGKRCQGMERAIQLSSDRFVEIKEMYNRFVDRWNDVEDKHYLPDGLHDNQIGELQRVGSDTACFVGWGKRFVIFVYPNRRSYKHPWGQGLSTLRRRMWSPEDIRAVEVHFASGVSENALDEWLAEERRLYGEVNRYHSVSEFLHRCGIKPYSTSELVDLLAKIVDLREQGDFKQARTLFNGITIDHLPKLNFGTCMGVMLDADGFLFYVDHDWGNEYADGFLYDCLHSLDPSQPDGRKFLRHFERSV